MDFTSLTSRRMQWRPWPSSRICARILLDDAQCGPVSALLCPEGREQSQTLQSHQLDATGEEGDLGLPLGVPMREVG